MKTLLRKLKCNKCGTMALFYVKETEGYGLYSQLLKCEACGYINPRVSPAEYEGKQTSLWEKD